MRKKVQITKEDSWYCSLSPKEKEDVAYYAIKTYSLDKEDDPLDYHYPECTTVWLALSNDHKEDLYKHFKQCKVQ